VPRCRPSFTSQLIAREFFRLLPPAFLHAPAMRGGCGRSLSCADLASGSTVACVSPRALSLVPAMPPSLCGKVRPLVTHTLVHQSYQVPAPFRGRIDCITRCCTNSLRVREEHGLLPNAYTACHLAALMAAPIEDLGYPHARLNCSS
jgi:hypothetical protein